jgi:excisionase family DNA binding protein
MNDRLALELVEAIASSAVALERLRELVGGPPADAPAESRTRVYTVRTLAGELGRSERSIRGAIRRGELEAARRGRGYLIAADAVTTWARAPVKFRAPELDRSSRRQRSEPGPATRALRGSR